MGRVTVGEGVTENRCIPTHALFYGSRSIPNVGGTARVYDDGQEVGQMGWLATLPSPNENTMLEELRAGLRPPAMMIGRNGGPLAPGIAHNGQIWGGLPTVPHCPDGHVHPETYREYKELAEWEHIRALTHAFNTTLVLTDPISTGRSTLEEVTSITNPHWYLSDQKDAECLAAFSEWQLEQFAPPGSPLILACSSFAVQSAVRAALLLHERGISTSGLLLISGNYDRSFLDYSQTQNPYPFASLLPVIAMTNAYHNTATKAHSQSAGFFERAQQFSKTYYMDLLIGDVSSRKKGAIIRTLANLTGLSENYLADHNYRVTPHEYCEERFSEEGLVLSALDGRLRYPKTATPARIDPKLDAIEPHFIANLQELARKGWIPSIFAQGYQGIQPYGNDPRWQQETASILEPLRTLLERVPGLFIKAIDGWFDLTCPAPRQHDFFTDVLAGSNLELQRARDQVAHDWPNFTTGSSRSSWEPKIDLLTCPQGHQLAYDLEPRSSLGLALRSLAYVVRLRNVHPEPFIPGFR